MKVKRSSSRALRRLCAVLAASSIVTGAFVIGGGATPAFAAQAHKPKAQIHKPKLTAEKIIGKAVTDVKAATSVRAYTRTTEAGLTITEADTYAQQGCLNAFSAGSHNVNISENILVVGTSEWVQPNDEFWQTLGYTGTELTSLEGKWLTLGAYENLFGIKGLPSSGVACNIHTFAQGMPSSPKGWILDKSVLVSGAWAWRLTYKDLKVTVCPDAKPKCQTSRITAYVSDVGKPEFIRLSLFGINENYYDYNAAVTLAAPPAADVLTSVPQPPGGTQLVAARQLAHNHLLTLLADAVHQKNAAY